MYPYQVQFARWEKNIQHLSQKSISNADHCLTNFFNYAQGNFASPELEDIKASDIRDYLNQLDTKEHLATTTINKYTSYIKKYFYYLHSAGIVENYPLLDLKGQSFNRKKTFVINWMDYISDFIGKVHHPYTIYLFELTALGYTSNELLSIRFSDIKDKIKDKRVKDYFLTTLAFDKDSDPFIFASRSGAPYSSTNNIMQLVKEDKEIFPQVKLTLTSLRLSYVYSLVTNEELNDAILLKKLRCTKRNLAYYQYNASYCNLINYSDLKL